MNVQRKRPKRRTNVSIDAQLLAEARAMGVNLSAALESKLAELLKTERQRRWLEENKAGFEAANAFIEKHGLWSDGRRLF